METKIIIEGSATLKDDELREWFSKMQAQIDTINTRTKQHTRDIRELRNAS